jgi:GxxExxY protein
MTQIIPDNTDKAKFIHEEITSKIIEAFYNVYNKLGFGFLEKVYHNAMEIELSKYFDSIENQKSICVLYDGKPIGDYYADFLIASKVIIEIKAVEILANEHELQLLNYLKATNIEIGLLLNFGKKPQIKRKIFTNNKKNL